MEPLPKYLGITTRKLKDFCRDKRITILTWITETIGFENPT
jgi:hypothetical protein